MTAARLDELHQAKIAFGAEIRRLRKASRHTQQSLAQRIGYSRVYVTNVENGRDIPGDEFVRLIGAELNESAELESLFTAVLHAHRSVRKASQLPENRFDATPIELTTAADGDDTVLVRAQSLDGELVLVNINRREALRRLGAAAALASLTPGTRLLDLALHVSPDLATPIEHLRLMHHTLIESDNIFGSAHALPGTHEQLRIIERIFEGTRGADRRALIHLRAQFAESMAWLSQDQADHGAAWYWSDRALEWSHLAGDSSLTSIVLVRKSQLAGDSGDGPTALDFAQAAADSAPTTTRIPAVAQLCLAHGHALAGHHDDSAQAYDTARELARSTGFDPEATWGGWLDQAYIDAQQARSLSALDHHPQAITAFDRALAALPDGYPRDRGVYLARAAHAYSRAGEVEQAAQLGIDAIGAGQAVRSGRIDQELRSLLDEFGSIDTEAVSEFRELAHTANLI